MTQFDPSLLNTPLWYHYYHGNVNKSLGLISYNPLSRNPNPEFLSALHLDEFLPAVNSWMIWGGVLLPTAMGIAVIVGAITPLPVTVKADGVVRPQGEIKVVQSSLDGIISMIAHDLDNGYPPQDHK
jgi:hypothetical protein